MRNNLIVVALVFVCHQSLTAADPPGHEVVRVTRADARGACEASVAINPVNPDHIVGVSQQRPRQGGPRKTNYSYVSLDGGRTWKTANVSSVGGRIQGDDAIAFGPDGVAHHVYIAFDGIRVPRPQRAYTGIYASSSRDGETWTTPVPVVDHVNSVEPFEDKPYLCLDTGADSPHRGNIYVAWTRFDVYGSKEPQHKSHVYFARSRDGGKTFSAAHRISDTPGDCLDSDNTVEGAVPAVGPQGEVYVAWAGPKGIVCKKSTDGGWTFGKEIAVSDMPEGWDSPAAGITRHNGLPVTAVDRSAGKDRGTVYVNWIDKRHGDLDVFVAASRDGGATWESPVRVNDDSQGAGKDQLFTWMAVDPLDGSVNVVFFDRRDLDGTRTGVRLARSVDGGRTFVNHKVNQEPFEFHEGVFFGDYSGIDARGGLVVAMYPHFVGDKQLAISAAVFRFKSGTQELRNAPPQQAAPDAAAPADKPPVEKPKESAPIAFAGVTVVDVVEGKLRPDQTLVIAGDKIVAAGPRSDTKPPANSRIVEANGKYLIPGLWDMHVHIAGADYMPLFLANGVTGVRDLHAFYPAVTLKMRDDVREGKILGPRIVAAGALIDGRQAVWPGALKAVTPDEGRAAVRKLKEMKVDFVKVYESLPRDVYFAIVDEAKKQGMTFAGHVTQNISAAEASDAGQKSIEHLSNLTLSCSKDEEALRKQLVDHLAKADRLDFSLITRVTLKAIDSRDETKSQALYDKFVRNQTWQTPTLVVLRAMAHGDDEKITGDPRIKYMSPFLRQFWNSRKLPPQALPWLKKSYAHTVDQVRAMHKAGVPMLAGSDCSNPYVFPGFSLHDELALLVEAGLSPADALRAATVNPAKFFGEEATAGAIAAGKRADLVLLDADPLADIRHTQKIRGVVANGRYLSHEEIQKLLADAETGAGGGSK
jgi:imidazolonepropionase-like amidohydrolase